MSRYTITPWRTHSDLLSVRQQLYSLNTDSTPTQNQHQRQNGNPDLRHQAVSQIMAWKLRGNLPHAVESTALLTDAILHHDLSINSIFSVRAVYAAAFTRFVTGFCDIGRNRERALEPSSMLVIARQIDMPDEFVALRHEATHEDLPSVQRLVAVCEQALEWLWRVYWSRLPDEAAVTGADVAKASEVDVQQVRDEGGKLLKEYRKARRQLFRTKAQTPMKVQLELINKTAGDLETLCRNQESAIVALTETLVNDKTLYPSDRGFGAAMNGAYFMWDGILQAVSKRQNIFLSTLVTGMHTRLNQPSAYHNVLQDPEKEALYLWLLQIASSDSWSSVHRSTGIDVGADVMTLCCLHPSPWSHTLGNALLEAGNDAFVESWTDLLEASAIAGSMQLDTGSDGQEVDDAQDANMGEAEEPAADMPDVDTHSEAAADLTAWREALKAPRVPIGVV